MTEPIKITDDLTALADKYSMSDEDRTALFELYLSAHNPPQGYKLMPEEPEINMINAALGSERFGISHSTWAMLQDKVRDQYRAIWKAAPVMPWLKKK